MSPSETSSTVGSNGARLRRPTFEMLRAVVLPPVRALAFWTAIALPLLYVPVLTTDVVWEHPLALLALFLLNGAALLVGHEHRQPDGDDGRTA